jgi:putative transposase
MWQVVKVRLYPTEQQSLKNLEKAFKNFFEGRSKFPKFKSRFHKQAIAYPQRVFVTKNGDVKLPKIGEVRAKITRPIEGKIKTVTVSKTSTEKYFASILMEIPALELTDGAYKHLGFPQASAPDISNLKI